MKNEKCEMVTSLEYSIDIDQVFEPYLEWLTLLYTIKGLHTRSNKSCNDIQSNTTYNHTTITQGMQAFIIQSKVKQFNPRVKVNSKTLKKIPIYFIWF